MSWGGLGRESVVRGLVYRVGILEIRRGGDRCESCYSL